jgi:predicted phosphoribosyltransferase
LSATHPAARFLYQVKSKEDRIMRGIVKLLIALAFGAALSGCIVAPVGPPRRAYVGVGVVAPTPVVVVRGGYWVR